MPNIYDFKSKNEYSKEAVRLITHYLKRKGHRVLDVQNHHLCQKKDIDLVTYYQNQLETLEIKSDQYTTGNFFFETVSNAGLNRLGCFMYTESDYIYYYFSEWDKLYILPTKDTRNWFIQVMNTYREIEVRTSVNPQQDYYHSYGRIVPIQDVLKNVKVQAIECLSQKAHTLAS